MIPAIVERRARWVLDSIGATELGFGDDLPYDAAAWEQIDRGERPVGDELADGFFHLARVEERNGARDEHGRFRAEWSCLDPLDPPLERLRQRLGVTTRDDRPRFTMFQLASGAVIQTGPGILPPSVASPPFSVSPGRRTRLNAACHE